MKRYLSLAVSAIALAACSNPAPESSAPETDTAETQTDAQSTERTAGYNEDRNAYFGDLHIHTRSSFDAYIFNVRRTADDAYRFARGDTITHPSGFDMTIAGGPLDFYTVTDHAEYLGILPAMNTPGTELSELPRAKDMFSTDPGRITAAFQGVGASVRSGEVIAEMHDTDVMDSVWMQNVAAADRHYVPGEFTTFAAYEYTSVAANEEEGSFAGGNLHRNVFFKGDAPDRAFSTLDSTNPEDLWDWMDAKRAEGYESIAIPHNPNVSDGLMFRLQTYNGDPLDAAYAEQRMRNEPLVEVTQVKGTSETHPALSPNDEWADFEIYDRLLASYEVSKAEGSYVREAYRNGLKLQEEQGFDPFRFGLVAASDSHVIGGAYAENDYWSKVGIVDGTPMERGSVPFFGTKSWDEQPDNQIVQNAREWFSRWGASGLTGVWAEENTRESIFDAFRRKETFATTGPRMKVRFFAGFDYSDDIVSDSNLTRLAYDGGVPMGSDLVGNGAAPTFLAWAQRDPNMGALQSVQIIKVTSEGEAVYDVACHDGTPDPDTHRCTDNGAAVDMKTCTPTGDGASELKALWQDPEFDPERRATYYVRVLENPSCRWSTWEAMRANVPPRPDVPQTIQERAYTSPIWYIPSE
ncbi:DUF3604 domain-containing protein [Hyphomonas atlantica corrig.]|uniref:DUF3604 domain-containing protein n=1 Tax=Hyphomonas atlantica TaxID=1280948 RepID=UPI00235646BE|nr:DUF3604 domain-containing protein [Hyphomonas atlantica]